MLPTEESAKLLRFARVVERAEEVFQAAEPALAWLKADNAALGGITPLSLLDTLGRIEHGVFA